MAIAMEYLDQVHLRDISQMMLVVHDPSGPFARLPRDILRWVLSPMILHPYWIVHGDGTNIMITNRSKSYINGLYVGYGDRFIRTKTSWLVAYGDSEHKVGLHGICASTPIHRPLVCELPPVYANVRDDKIQVSTIDRNESYSMGNLPREYNRVVRFSIYYNTAMLWNGDRKLAWVGCDGTDTVPFREFTLPHAPVSVCAFNNANDVFASVMLTYPWGIMDEYVLE